MSAGGSVACMEGIAMEVALSSPVAVAVVVGVVVGLAVLSNPHPGGYHGVGPPMPVYG